VNLSEKQKYVSQKLAG